MPQRCMKCYVRNTKTNEPQKRQRRNHQKADEKGQVIENTGTFCMPGRANNYKYNTNPARNVGAQYSPIKPIAT